MTTGKPPEISDVAVVMTVGNAWKIATALIAGSVLAASSYITVLVRLNQIEDRMITTVEYQQIRDDAANQNPPLRLPPLPRRADIVDVAAKVVAN